MSKKKSIQFLKYIQKRINSGVHPDDIANHLNIRGISVLMKLKQNNLPVTYKSKVKNSNIINSKVFRNISTEAEAYYLGLILADGCISIRRNNFNLAIALKQRDCYIFNKLNNIISNTNFIKAVGNKDQSVLRLSSKVICNNLIQYSIIPNKTYICNSIPFLSEELMPHFIRGYFDGDGSVYNKKQRNKIGSAVSFTGHYNFISSLELYLKSRNILSTKVQTKQKKHQFDSVFEFEKKQDIKNLYNYMYKDASIYLTRKKDKFII